MPTTRQRPATRRRTQRRQDSRPPACRTDTGHRRRHNKCRQCRPVPKPRKPLILVDRPWISSLSSSSSLLLRRTTVSNSSRQLQHINSSTIPMRTMGGRRCIRRACSNSNIRLQICHLRRRPDTIRYRRSSNTLASVSPIRIPIHPTAMIQPREASQQAILTDQVPTTTTISNPRHVPQ